MNKITHEQVEAKYHGALAQLKKTFEDFFAEPEYSGTETDATKAVSETEFFDSEHGLQMEHKGEVLDFVWDGTYWTI